jgi:ethanolamine permease
MGSAFICLCLCNAELTSSFPFAGGAYGINRITFGLYPGFLIGCCEAVQYITYVATASFLLSQMLEDIWLAQDFLVPVICLLFYLSACLILIYGEQYFWRFSTVFGITSLLIVLVYCFGSLPFVDMARYTPYYGTTGSSSEEDRPQWFIGGMVGFMKNFPLSAWFLVGVESLNLSGSDVYDPKTTIPIASICCVFTCSVTSVFVLFVCSSLPMLDNIPTARMATPLTAGFALMFNIPVSKAIVLSLPAMYATCYGFVFAFSRILISMSKSGLLPPIFKRTYGKHKAPYAAILAGSSVCYVLCLAMYLKPSILDYLLPVCMLSAFIAYISQFIGYVLFKKKYGHYATAFTSPLGVWGAWYGGFVFSLGAVGICAFQDDCVAFITILFLGFFYTIYYFAYARRRQVFSDEEKMFFPMQILKCKYAHTFEVK